MRRFLSLVSVVVASCSSVMESRATLIAYEGFDYTSGSNMLALKNGGTGWGGAWDSGPSDITAGGFNYTDSLGNQLITVGNRAATDQNVSGNFRSLPATYSTGTVYLSFLLQCTNASSEFNYGGLSLFFGASEQIFFGEITGEPPRGALGSERLGAGAFYFPGTDASLLNFVVVKIQFDAGTTAGNERVSISINPPLNAEPVAPVPFVPFPNTASFSFNRLRIQSGRFAGSSLPEIAHIDEIRIGTTYADVTPHVVPEPGVFGLLSLGCFAFLQRRRICR